MRINFGAWVILLFLKNESRGLSLIRIPKKIWLTKGVPTVQTQGANIRRYSDYLLERARGYRDTRTDYVRGGSGRLKKLTVDKGLLRETEAVQNQIEALVKCDVSVGTPRRHRRND